MRPLYQLLSVAVITYDQGNLQKEVLAWVYCLRGSIHNDGRGIAPCCQHRRLREHTSTETTKQRNQTPQRPSPVMYLFQQGCNTSPKLHHQQGTKCSIPKSMGEVSHSDHHASCAMRSWNINKVQTLSCVHVVSLTVTGLPEYFKMLKGKLSMKYVEMCYFYHFL